jgi:hypothetical protein
MPVVDDISETDQIQPILKKANFPALKTGFTMIKTPGNCYSGLIQNGMVSCQELISSIGHISARGLAV